MNSIKNTVVALGLLGLSFAFYHFSATPEKEVTEDDTSQMASLAEHSKLNDLKSESFTKPIANEDEFAQQLEPMTAPAQNLRLDDSLEPRLPEPKVQPKIPNIEAPRLPTQKKLNGFDAPELAGNGFDQPKPRTAPLDGMKLTPDESQAMVDPIKRDQGLIQALEIQRSSTNQSLDRSFEQQASGSSETNAFQPDAGMEPFSSTDHAPGSSVDSGFANANAHHFRDVWPEVEQLVEQNQLRSSLQKLSAFYNRPDLNGPQKQLLHAWLDGLAGKVVFSAEHRLTGKAYICDGNESLIDLAEQWKVPAKLIYNVNQNALGNFNPSDRLPAGQSLKQIAGPFHATVKLSDRTLTMFVDGLYAGRFPVRMGVAGQPGPGKYRVLMKSLEGATWRDADGNDYPPSSPNNGYGPYFLGLEGRLCVHAVDKSKTDGHFGCVGLNEKDAKDLFEILSVDSVVTIVE